MRRQVRLLASGLVVLASLGPTGAIGGPQFRGGSFDPPRPAPDFALPSTNGANFQLSKHRGRVITLGFGYTFCPDVCPTTLADLAQVRQRLGPAGARLQVVYVTVDPGRDTPERLRTYMHAFDKTFIGLTGTPEQLAQVRKIFGVSIKKEVVGDSPMGYLIHHTASIYLIDPSGQLRVMFPFGTSISDMVHDVKILLAANDHGPAVRVESAWARRAPMAAGEGTGSPRGNGVVYLTLKNISGRADAVVAAASDAAHTVELHETYSMSGMAMMRRVPNIAVPARGTAVLKPGGYHLMLIGLKRDLKPGDTVVVTLTLEKAGKVEVDAKVR